MLHEGTKQPIRKLKRSDLLDYQYPDIIKIYRKVVFELVQADIVVYFVRYSSEMLASSAECCCRLGGTAVYKGLKTYQHVLHILNSKMLSVSV